MASSYAMSAKAKAMFGQRLTPHDYEALLNKRTIAEIANYLKNDTYYKVVLGGINESQIHRGELESLIRKDSFERFSRLIRYGASNDSGLYRYGIILSEIEQIIACIKSFQTKDKVFMIANLPLFLERFMSFDIKRLADVHSFEELFEVLEHTAYAQLLKPYETTQYDEIDIVSIETVLDTYYFEEVGRIVKNDRTIKDKTLINEIFNTRIELDNITKIYRLKKFFKANADEIVKVIVPTFHHIKQKKLQELIYNTNAEEFLEALQQTFYGKYLDPSRFEFIELETKSITNKMNRRAMSYSSDPNIVLFAYMGLCETEIQNIVDIIEGVRYNVARDKIKSLLIL